MQLVLDETIKSSSLNIFGRFQKYSEMYIFINSE